MFVQHWVLSVLQLAGEGYVVVLQVHEKHTILPSWCKVSQSKKRIVVIVDAISLHCGWVSLFIHGDFAAGESSGLLAF